MAEEGDLPPLPTAIGVVGTVPSFTGSGNADDWEYFKIQLSYFFLANNITDPARKKAILFTAPGDYILRQAIKLRKPQSTMDMAYDDVITLLDTHITPRPSKIVSRNTFRLRLQKAGESSKDFLAELRQLAEPCLFEGQLEDFLLSQFTMGLRDMHLKESLMRQDNLTLVAALAKAVASESAKESVSMLHASPGWSTQVNKASSYHQHLKGGPAPEQREPKRHYQKPIKRDSGKPIDNSNATQPLSSGSRCKACNGPHERAACRFKNAVCHYCQKKGHIAPACRKKDHKEGTKPPVSQTNIVDCAASPLDLVNWKLHYATVSAHNCQTAAAPPPFTALLNVEGQDLRFEVDSGAGVTLIGAKTYFSLLSHCSLQDPSMELKTWSEEKLPVAGKINVSVKTSRDGEPVQLPLMVMRNDGPSLLGRQWFKPCNIALSGAALPSHINVNKVADRPVGLPPELSKFANLFSPGLGMFTGPPAQVLLQSTAKPVFRRPRPVPLALQARVSAELDRMVTQGILEPVATSEWGTPTVNVVKPNGKIRICGDYSGTINPVCQREIYPLPTIQELLSNLAGGKYFAKLDLSDAYLQVPLDEESSKMLTLNTHRGLFRVKRLPPGFTSATAIFQRKMEVLMAPVKNVVIYLDDMLLKADSKNELIDLLNRVLTILSTAGLKLRLDKCMFCVTELDFMGYHIAYQGISPSDSKVQQLLNARSPSSLEELQVYLGFINYYDRFFPDKANIFQPLCALQVAGQPWKWTSKEEACISYVRKVLSTVPVLAHYSSTEPLIVACDAAPHGVGAVMSHVPVNGAERPILYVSRSLKPAEKNYSQLDKEALSIVFAIKKLHMFFAGRQFKILTDHKPLLGIFRPGKPIPDNLSPRLLRWCLLLSNYDYEIEYRMGKMHCNADFFSRFPTSQEDSEDTSNNEESQVGVLLLDVTNDRPLSSTFLADATGRDPVLAEVRAGLLRGWSPAAVSLDARKYLVAAPGVYTVMRGVVLRGNRVVVPHQLQPQVLAKLHEVHQGVVKTKAIARSYVYWPNIDKNIEDLVAACPECAEHRPSPPSSTVIPWSVPQKPWSRLHLDFAGPVNGHTFLIAVDAGTKWVDAIETNGSFSAETAISFCRTLFSNHGIPDEVVQDNGPAFRASEFSEFLRKNNVKQIFSAPYKPASNGQAERTVRTVKTLLSKIPPAQWKKELPNLLLTLRVTPSAATGLSPAEMLMGRTLSTVLSKLHPANSVDLRSTARDNQVAGLELTRTFEIGDPIYFRNYGTGKKWCAGTVSDVLGPRNLCITSVDGRIERRHIDQVYRRKLNKSPNVDFSVPDSPSEPSSSIIANREEAPTSDVLPNAEANITNPASYEPQPSTSHEIEETQVPNTPGARLGASSMPLRRSERLRKSVYDGSLKDLKH